MPAAMPAWTRFVAWLPGNIPAGDETGIVHGDFRCDNMIFHPTEPRILAVLDWELSTLGHPLADFAYHAMMYPHAAGIVARSPRRCRSRLVRHPQERDYVAAYAPDRPQRDARL